MTATVTGFDEPRPPTSGASRRIFLALLTTVIVAAVLVAVLAVIVVSRISAARHTAIAPLGDTKTAAVDIASGVTSVTVRSADLGPDLYRISTSGDAAEVPSVSTVDRVLSV